MRIFLSLVALMAAASQAFAADVKGTSKIEGVTVFPSGAEVIRRTTIKLEPGEHAVLLQDLPGQAIGASIRVEGTAKTGKLEIGSVDVRTLQVPLSDPGAGQTARKKIEDEIEKLKDERDAVEAVAQTAKAQLAYLENLAKLPTTPNTYGGGAAVSSGKEDWGAVYGVIGGKTAELAKVGLDTKIKLRAIDKQLVDWSKELAAASPKQESRTEARINVVAATPVEATLTVRYQVPNASWTAFYDARLTSGDKATAPKLGLTRRASIQQRTGEDWTDVTVALSTTRPGHTTAVPDLRVLHVDYVYDQGIMPAGAAMSRSVPGAVMQDKLDEASQSVRRKAAPTAAPAAPEPVAEAVTQVSADTTNAAFQTVFDIPGKVTIKTTGETKRVQIEAADLEPTLIVKSMPRHDTTAYLYTKVALPKTASPALAGPVSLFRDGIFVGTGRLPQLAPGEDHELGFGADDRVKIKRAVLEDKKGETGTFTTSKVEVRNFKITAKNHHARPVQISILDQVPVSAQQDIKVEVVMAGPQPTRKDVGDVRGTLVWDMTVAPDEEKQIGFGYKVVSPNDKRIGYQLNQPNFNSQGVNNFGATAKF
jgi:uncharacterized protein (TIGR02231 family)